MALTGLYGGLFFAVLCMSSSSIMIKLSTAPVMIMVLYRLLFTASLALPLKLGFKEAAARWDRRLLLQLVMAGIFLALHFVFWFTSLSYTSVSSSVLFTNQQVLFVLLFSVVALKEPLARQAIYGVVMALLGCAIIAGGDMLHGNLWGDFLALVSGFCIAGYLILGRRLRQSLEAWTYSFLVSLVAAAVLLPFIIWSGLEFFAYPAREWGLFFLMALLPGICGHGIINWALKYLKAPLIAVSILGETVSASIMALLILQEALGLYQIIGGGLILSGIYLAMTNEARSD